MLASFYFRQTTRQVVRASLSTLPSKSSETPANYPSQRTSTSNEKLEPIATNDLLEAKRSNTTVLPGVPVTAKVSPLAQEQPRSTSDAHPDRVPSSRFTAFLRSIRSGLPFFPSPKPSASAMDLATTREHFLPVSDHRQKECLVQLLPCS